MARAARTMSAFFAASGASVGNDALGDVVEALEVASAGDRDAPLSEEHFHRVLAFRPAPPRAAALAGHRQLAR
jgi:hypothetical protein